MRRSAVDAQLTRDTIIARAAEIASVEGLDGVTIGRLATGLAMSKSGILGHFGTKEGLQLAAIGRVIADFQAKVVEPALTRGRGLPRLIALCDRWFAYLADTGLPGGCLLTAAAVEFDTREGEVHDTVADLWDDWRKLFRAELRRTDLDVEQCLFELMALGPAVNQAIQLHGDHQAPERARRAARRVLQSP